MNETFQDTLKGSLLQDLLPPFERGTSPPAACDIEPFPGEDLARLQIFLEDILGQASLDEKEKVLALLRFVCGELRNVPSSSCIYATGAAALDSGYVTCAGFAKAMVALSRAASIPAREASFNGLPTSIGHTVCEVWLDSAWVCLDPKFGLFFADSNDWKRCSLLSVHDLVTRSEKWTLLQVLSRPWQGSSQLTESGIPEPVTPRNTLQQELDLNVFYQDILRKSYPVTYRKTATCFPLTANLRDTGHIELVSTAAVQESPGARILGLGQGNGSISLGYAYMNLLWLLTDGNCDVDVQIQFQETPPPLQCLPLAYVRTISQRRLDDNTLSFTLRPGSPEAMCLLYAHGSYGFLQRIVLQKND